MKNISFFPGFNSLRFIAAYLVLTTHIELIRVKYNLYNFSHWPIINEGTFAVELFFVLSGFLITYLLLKEKDKTGTISIKKFYLRRVLRIWPLYYIIVIAGLIIIPAAVIHFKIQQDIKIPFYPSILLYICMLPNLVSVIYGSSFLTPLRSIGVEEQFYLVWAPVFKYIKKYFVFFLFGVLFLRVFSAYIIVPYLLNTGNTVNIIIANFISTIKVECMAIGALGAVFLFSDKFNKLSRFIFSFWLQLLMLLYFSGIFLLHISKIKAIPIIDNTIIHSFFIQLFLFNVSLNPAAIVKLKNKYLDFLGKISYGIYMYHPIVVFTIIFFLKNILINMHPFWATLTSYSIVSVVVFFIAYISFKFIEKPILKLKN